MVERVILTNKPLVEAIFEIKWKLKETSPHIFIDENFNLLTGILYDKISNEYPFPVNLVPDFIPLESSPYAIRTQFRKQKEQWPLVQLGPGILTVNDTESYVWEDFQERIIYILKCLFESFSKLSKEIQIESLILRYIDAFDFDYNSYDVYEFLQEQLKLHINLTPKLFAPNLIDSHPNDLNIDLTYKSKNPPGKVTLKFSTGHRKNLQGQMKPAVIWNTVFQSEENMSNLKEEGIIEWVNGAHTVTDHIFFTIIEGKLLEKLR